MRKTDNDLMFETIRYHHEHAQKFAEMGTGFHPTLAYACELMLAKSAKPHCLVLGCGPGGEIEPLRTCGIERLICIEAAQNLLAIAYDKYPREAYPYLEFRHGNILDIKRLVSEKCEAFICQSVLMSLPKKRLPQFLADLRSVLVDGAVGLIVTYRGTRRVRVTHNLDSSIPQGYTALLQYWRDEKLEKVLRQNGFDVEFHDKESDHIVFIVRAT